MAWILHSIRGSDPLQLGFPFALWTRAMVRNLLLDRFNVKLSDVSVGRLLRTLGLTSQRPLYRAYQQDPILVEQWKEMGFPKIRRMAKKAKALIFVGDEAGIRSDCPTGRTWGIRGKTPVVKASGARFSVNMLSAVSPDGRFRYMVHEGRVTADTFYDFLRRL